MEINKITETIIGAAIEVHRHLGPGLLESAYQACLAREMDLRNLAFEQEKQLFLEYKGLKLDCGYRLGFLVGPVFYGRPKSCRSPPADPRSPALNLSQVERLQNWPADQLQCPGSEEWPQANGPLTSDKKNKLCVSVVKK